MKIQLRFIYTLGCILLSIAFTAFIKLQNPKTTTSKELFVAYTDMSKLDVALEVNAFMSEEGKKGKESIASYQMEYRSDNSQRGLWYTMGDEIVLRNEKWALQIDNKQKTIVYYKRDPKQATKETLSEEEKTQFTESMAAYVKNEDMKFTYLKKEGNLTAYQTTQMPYPIKKTVFWFNEKKHIVKTTYDYHPNEYGQTNYVEVTYKIFNPTPSFDKLTFSEKIYIQARGKKITPSKAFQDYTVINAQDYSAMEE
ncbi:hypothetical protein WAF17_22360 (plasmid) [Bernardetia sp. ABR2-2B]|uniref:hypothetical protein n=1 Tax=Bernardetia sp. ABR2-2B TaxID=3127472 RepID=UPI0030D269BE